ncbi:MAG: (E)-4-hydroxy-3-methylbut-2-enyl-diphosphate synthase [Candidatus Neomarinimicrobiota bacterium]|nr:4-hydroxy-3-methylbut-2-en-1-yl diphosphate synthase [Candidatus Neomarinimicrobiota bacterium]
MQEYCNSLTKYSRFATREVRVGNLYIGGQNPIRIQSMTTTDTMDTKSTIAQSVRLIESGCELVRITAPSLKEAENLKIIRKGIRDLGYQTPIVADIHFTPNAAELAARIVEKVRINPGNYADKKKFKEINYTDDSYLSEIERIRKKFSPLVSICKEYGTAMRIGTNHGSLSDRIMSRYGDTPLGMVESAMEFIRIAEEMNYFNIILSMKASNTRVMVQAYRLLVKMMQKENMNYPLHLGVTEAGEAEDGRIKSSVGIGTLLQDGLGDTIRVSLTEEPEAEIPVCKVLVDRLKNNSSTNLIETHKIPYDPYFYSRRNTSNITNMGVNNVPIVFGDLSKLKSISYNDLNSFGYIYSKSKDKWYISDQAIDYLYIGSLEIEFELPGTLRIVQDSKAFKKKDKHYPLFEYNSISEINKETLSFIIIDSQSEIQQDFSAFPNSILILKTDNENRLASIRRFFIKCINEKILNPIIIKNSYKNIDENNLLMDASTDFGGLLIDGFGDGLWVDSEHNKSFINELSFGILQASRSRISKTEYISCPSCGRTLFDLQETTSKIRSKLDHLKGLKIGVMGCIVNGPGEMADADYGYVGVGKGKISLYKGQEVVKTNIPELNALDALIDLIKVNGDWKEVSEV